MTPQQHKQHLLALAEKLSGMDCGDYENDWQDVILHRASVALRDFAARLTPGVSDAMVEKACVALGAQPGWTEFGAWLSEEQDELRGFVRLMLEAVFPLVDDGQAKDAARLCLISAECVLVAHGGAELCEAVCCKQGELNEAVDFLKSTGKPHTDLTLYVLNAPDAAMAAPPKDTV